MTDSPRPRVSRTAYLLGYAGLLPQVAAAALGASVKLGLDRHGQLLTAAHVLAFGYSALILSFLGGVWWGFAMRRLTGQGALAAVAVVPSLAAGALLLLTFAKGAERWALVLLGLAITLTLPVDRYLAATREAPEGWMALRVPLSLGLGGLTVLVAVLLP